MRGAVRSRLMSLRSPLCYIVPNEWTQTFEHSTERVDNECFAIEKSTSIWCQNQSSYIFRVLATLFLFAKVTSASVNESALHADDYSDFQTSCYFQRPIELETCSESLHTDISFVDACHFFMSAMVLLLSAAHIHATLRSEIVWSTTS